MVEHQSKEVVDKMSQELKIQPAGALPRNIVNSIQPVYNVNPIYRTNIVAAKTSSATSSTMMTVPTDRPFFLTSAFLHIIKDSSAVSTATALNVTLKGKSELALILIPGITLTAQDTGTSANYGDGMELEPGSLIRITMTSATAVLTSSATITGYTVDKQ